ncbi:IS110 family transposase [Micromonospora sp. LZ34]
MGWLFKSVPPLAAARPWRGSTEACSPIPQVRLPATAIVLFAWWKEPGRPVITIGIDPHKPSLTAVALDETGKPLATRRITVNAAAYKTLTGCAARWPQRRFAVEGAAGLGRGIAQLLAAAGEDVVDVPATLAARARLLDSGGTRKTDAADAASVAHAATRHQRLRQVVAEDHHTRLRLLSERRDDLARERVRLLNRLHALLRDLIPGGAALDLTADKAAALLRGIRLLTATNSCRRDLVREMIADLRHLDRRLDTNQAQIRQVLAETHSSITTIHGVGHIIAAKILGHVGDITRFPTADHFASYAGTSPLEASSGERRRHRLNPTGNRQLDTALHTIAVCQARDPGPGRVYYQRKLSEGKTPAEARRALKTATDQCPLPTALERSTQFTTGMG